MKKQSNEPPKFDTRGTKERPKPPNAPPVIKDESLQERDILINRCEEHKNRLPKNSFLTKLWFKTLLYLLRRT